MSGGTGNCGFCLYNMWYLFEEELNLEYDSKNLTFCLLRKVMIPDIGQTYCINFRPINLYLENVNERFETVYSAKEEIKGTTWIYGIGWDGKPSDNIKWDEKEMKRWNNFAYAIKPGLNTLRNCFSPLSEDIDFAKRYYHYKDEHTKKEFFKLLWVAKDLKEDIIGNKFNKPVKDELLDALQDSIKTLKVESFEKDYTTINTIDNVAFFAHIRKEFKDYTSSRDPIIFGELYYDKDNGYEFMIFSKKHIFILNEYYLNRGEIYYENEDGENRALIKFPPRTEKNFHSKLDRFRQAKAKLAEQS